MTIRDINGIINAVCPNDEDYEKPCISPKYLRQELEKLALGQEQKYLEQEPTTKNDLGVDCIDRQATLDAIIKRLGIKNETYLLEAERAIYQQILAMPSVTPQLSSGLEKNSNKLEKDFGELDCISRADVLKLMKDNWHTHNGDWAMQESMDDIRALPSVTSQEPHSFKWCTDCKEYDQEKHCCHRFSKVIRDTVEEMKQESILDKIFCIVHPLSIMSTPELEHKAIMQIAEMLEPICLPESEG